MSVFGKIFGTSKKGPQALSTQDALQKLQETEDMLLKKQDFLEKKITTELATAKTHGTKNKRMALQALRRKKEYEKQQGHLDGVLNTIQTQKHALENASMNSEVLGVVSDAARAMKHAHNEMDVDKVHDLMEDIAEQQEVANEIANAISNPIGLQTDDEDELLKELEAMAEEDLSKQLLDTDIQPTSERDTIASAEKFPSAPTEELAGVRPKAPAKKTKQDEDDLAELEAWANA